MQYQFEYEATDRSRMPDGRFRITRHGTVVVEIEETANEVRDFIKAHTMAFAMVYGRRGVEHVTSLELVV